METPDGRRCSRADVPRRQNPGQYGLDVDGRIVAYFPAQWAAYQVARTSSDPASAAHAIVRR
ncbi:MAG: hypothetical protein ACM3NQ_02240, partial [Bacteroidales bacterium]